MQRPINDQDTPFRRAGRVLVRANPEEDFTDDAYLGFHVLAIGTGAIFSAWSLAIPDYFHFAVGAFFSLGLLFSLLILHFAGDSASRSFSLCVIPVGVMLLQFIGLVFDLSAYDFRVFPSAFALLSVALAGFLGRHKPVLLLVAGTASLSVLGSELYYASEGEHDIVEFFLMIAVLAFATFVSFQFFRTRTQLVDARKDAEQALALKNRFISNMSHEIRTPLAGIVGLTQLIPLASHEDERKNLIAGLQNTTESLRDQVNDMLDFQKLELTHNQHSPIKVHLPSMIEALTGEFYEELENRGLNCSINIPADTPEYVNLDVALFRTVLRALLSNATKFTEVGNVSVAVQSRYNPATAESRVSKAATEGAEDVLLSVTVTDTGIGMNADFIEQALEPFVQGDDGYAKRFAGVGLGLARARLAVSQLNGSMKIRSTPGSGTSVHVTVPVQTLSTEEATANDTE